MRRLFVLSSLTPSSLAAIFEATLRLADGSGTSLRHKPGRLLATAVFASLLPTRSYHCHESGWFAKGLLDGESHAWKINVLWKL